MTLILIMALMFFALICIGVPIAFSMGTASIWYLLTNGTSLSVAAQKFFTQTQSFSFLAVPFFVLAGTLMVEAGIAKKLSTLPVFWSATCPPVWVVCPWSPA